MKKAGFGFNYGYICGLLDVDMYEADDVVWVKPSRTPWWPAQVLHRDLWPKMKGKPPRVTCVKYLDEYSFEPVNHQKYIQPFLCPSRQQYQAAGLKSRNREAFRKALDAALEIVGCSEVESPTPQNDPFSFDLEEHKDENVFHEQNGNNTSQPVKREDGLGFFKSSFTEMNEDNGAVRKEGSLIGTGQNVIRGGPIQFSLGQQKLLTPTRSPVYTCEFCGYETTRLNNKILHDKACSPHKGKNSERGSLSPGYLSPTRSFPSQEEQSTKNLSHEETSSPNFSSCFKTDVSKGSSHDKGRKRSAAHLDVSSGSTRSFMVDSCTEVKLSKQGGFQNLKAAVNGRENGFCPKKALCVKGSRAGTVKNGKKVNSQSNSKGQKHSAATKTAKERRSKVKSNTQQSREKLSSVFQLPSEDSLLLTPDPVRVGHMAPDMPDMEPVTRSAAFDPNLNVDASDSDHGDSDEELPAMLTPVKHDLQNFQLSEGDLVWAQVKGWSYWPGVIKKVYRERKKQRVSKATVLFLNDDLYNSSRKRVYRLRCFNSRGKPVMFPFTCGLREKFERTGYASRDKELIEEAVKQVEDFLTKRALGIIKTDAYSFFFPNELLEADSEEEDMILGMRRRDRVCSVDSASSASSNSGEMEEFGEHEPVLSKSMKMRNEQRKSRCEKLVTFIKSDKMKEYLEQIFRGSRASSLHAKFHGTQKERDHIKYQGFGPISDEEQQTEIMDTLLPWINELHQPLIGNVDYVLDVWVPEAVVYALISVKKYGRGRAWKMFYKGIRFTKEEFNLAHKAILKAADQISPEDREMYRTKLLERMETMLPP